MLRDDRGFYTILVKGGIPVYMRWNKCIIEENETTIYNWIKVGNMES